MRFHKINLQLYKNLVPILGILSKKDKITFFSIITVQTIIASLDIIGIFFVGILASFSSNYILGTKLNSVSLSFIKFFELSDYSLKFIIFITAFFTLIFFITKSIISMVLNWKIFISS